MATLGPRYLLPDTNVIYHCMDVIEQSDCFADVIILQTVLDELRNKNMGLYERVRRLVQDKDKRFVVFFNEFHVETHVKCDGNETINDRNDRAVVRAAAWYNRHLGQSSADNPKVLLLSDDVGLQRRCAQSEVDVKSSREYISTFEDSARLLDMLSSTDGPATINLDRSQPRKQHYATHVGIGTMQDGVKRGTLHRGIITISTHNAAQGTIFAKGLKQTVQIIGFANLNRATDGDTVAVQILPEDQWEAPSDRIVDEENDDKKERNAEDEDDVEDEEKEKKTRSKTEATQPKPKQPCAKVVGIFKRNWRPFVGHVDANSVSSDFRNRGSQPVFVRPLDRRIPRIRIRTRQLEELLGQKIVVSIDRWDATTRFPEGHLVSVLGGLESVEAETQALLLEHGVASRPFPKVVLDCLPQEGNTWTVEGDKAKNAEQQARRADLRDLQVCSIDPPGCQDIDDALHARRLPNGNIEAGVHIADVSHFVKPSTAMDDEATARGTTVYMVDKRIDMLPALLGTNLCSLMPYVERYAFSVIWQFDADFNIVDSRFTKSIIKSREAFPYGDAQSRIDDKAQKDELTESMRTLLRISKVLKQRRVDAGALNLASPEIKIQMGSETSEPVDVLTKEPLATNSLVEEFMLLANISVARRIYESFSDSAMLRRHAEPPASNFDNLRSALRKRRDLDIQVESSKAVADSLDRCIDPTDPSFNTLVRIMATRCMLSAEYFYAAQYTREDFKHYGLATDIYTHFTSPIRRYADVVAHRQLAAAIGWEGVHSSLSNESALEATCKNINYRHRMAQMAGRASVEFFVGQALKNKESVEDASVLQVFSNGFVVFIPRLGIEGTVHLGDVALKHEATQFEPEEFALHLQTAATGKDVVVGIFDKVKVHVSTVYKEATGRRTMQLRWTP